MANFTAKPRHWVNWCLVSIPVLMALSYWLFGLTVFAVVTAIVLIAFIVAHEWFFPTRAPTGQDHMTRNPDRGA